MPGKVRNILFLSILIALAVRVLFLCFFQDIAKLEFWEYGSICSNLLAGKGYSLFYFQNEQLNLLFSSASSPFPSAYMPPGFVFIILPFFFIKELFLRNLLFLSFQILLSLGSLLLIFKITRSIFSETAGLIAGLLFAVYPEFIFASGTAGTTVVYSLLILSVFNLLLNPESGIKRLFLTGLLAGLSILVRSDAAVFVALIFFTLLFQKKFKNAIIIGFTCFAVILPWQIRNIAVFEKYIPFTTSTGVNFYRGNNPYQPGVWMDERMNSEIVSLNRDKNFEVAFNDYYIGETTKFIKNEPEKALENMGKKLFHFVVFNPFDKRTSNLIYIFTWLPLLILSVLGIFKFKSYRKTKYLLLFVASNLIIALIFFSLPRYQTMMKIALVPFAAYYIGIIVEKLKS